MDEIVKITQGSAQTFTKKADGDSMIIKYIQLI